MINRKKQKRIYFDYASTTPVDPRVLLAMRPYFSKSFHNPSALYREGVEVRNVLENSRKRVAAVLHGHSDEIFFTGSGTESNNIAILGIVTEARKHITKPHVIFSSIEHPAVLGLKDEIERRGGSMSIVPVDSQGIVDLKYLKTIINKNTVLVSIMYANNEIGTIEPIREIAKIIRDFRKSPKTPSSYPYFHTDASQAPNYLSLNTLSLGVDFLSLDGSKIYGPKGIGVLWARRGVNIAPVVFGGGQEKGLRSGTENLPSIVGFATALEIARSMSEKETKRLTPLREKIIREVLKSVPGSSLNGDLKERLPNNINICFPDMDAEYAVIVADSLGILCSTASSCKSLKEDLHSDVIEVLGGIECAKSSIRFSLGRGTKTEDIKILLNTIPEMVRRSRVV